MKSGGHLICIVPDEDLYEQGCFPSMFNHDHKHTFAIEKDNSWSDRSINIKELAKSLGGEVLSIERQDFNYNHTWINMKNSSWSRRLYRIFMKLRRFTFFRKSEVFFAGLFRMFGAKIDQTALDQDRLAQIQFVVKNP